MSSKVKYTGGIPECPYCKKPTKRQIGSTSGTLMYFPPTYDEKGRNINPDRNTNTTDYTCLNCGKKYYVENKLNEANYKP